MKERQVLTLPGVPVVLILIVLLGLCGGWLFKSVELLASLVVLCGERGTQPIVNTGTLYSG